MFLIALLLAILGFAGAIWTGIIAFQEGETLWAFGSVFLFPVALIYGFKNFEICRAPTIMLLLGLGGRVLLRMSGV